MIAVRPVPLGPARYPVALIVGVVGAYGRHWPEVRPPLFHAADVVPMLAGGDLEYEVASTLLDAGRVFYPPESVPDG